MRIHPVICAIALLLLTSVVAVNAAVLSYTQTIPLAPTDWNTTISIPKFNSSLGTLTSIEFILAGHAEGTAAFENRNGPGTVTMDLGATLQLERPDSTILVIAVPLVHTSDAVPTFDGVIDFGGTSGKTYSGLGADITESKTSTPPSSDLALFTGFGNIILPVVATGNSTGSGSGNLVTQFSSQASAQATVKYHYDAVPEPSGLLTLLSGLTVVGGTLTRLRRKRVMS